MSLILSVFKKLDFIGDSIIFKINKSGSFQTVFGGILSVLLYFSFIYFFYSFGKEFIYKINPSGYSKIEVRPDQKLSLEENKFFVGINLQDFSLSTLNADEYFFIFFSYSKFDLTKNIEENIPLPTIKCDKTKLNPNTDKGIYNLSEFYCPDLTSVGNMGLYGSWDTLLSSRINIYLSICNRDQTICKDPKEIDKKLDEKMVLLNMLVPKIEYSITNYEKPLITKLTTKYIILNTKQYLLEEFNFSKYELTDDRGTLLSDERTIITEGLGEKASHFDFRDNTKDPKDWKTSRDKYVYFGEISYSFQYVYFTRTYTKFFDIIGNVYGLGEISVFFVMFFYSFYSKIRLNSYLCMRLLYLEEDESIDLKGNKKNLNKNERRKSMNKLDYYFSVPAKKDSEEDNKLKQKGKKTLVLPTS